MFAKSPERSGASSETPSNPPAIGDEAPEKVLENIRSLLGQGCYKAAQRLAKEAAKRFPKHDGVAVMNRALNEWKASTSPGSGVDRSEEREWMRQPPPESLRGKVIALVGKDVVASADTMTELARHLRTMELAKRPLVFRLG